MTAADRTDATVLIATYNRATLLDQTLASLARMTVSAGLRWEAIVIDNNSSDATREVVEQQRRVFPVELRYLFEPRQGRSSALNTGIANARGRVLAFTDDDVRVADGWLDAACSPLLEPAGTTAYTGGPVRPIWGAPPPRWLDLTRGDLWGTIAIQDHGRERFVYEERRKVPLGANMAARKTFFETVGVFRPDLGRTGGRLVLGQEVPELLMRARTAGLRGAYIPEMEIEHHVPAARLTPRYFRKWWFGKGVSRAALARLQPITELGLDLRRVPHVLGVPRYMYGSAMRDVLGWMKERMRGRHADAFRHQMMLAYFAGYFWAVFRRPPREHALSSTTGDQPVQRTSNVVITGR